MHSYLIPAPRVDICRPNINIPKLSTPTDGGTPHLQKLALQAQGLVHHQHDQAVVGRPQVRNFHRSHHQSRQIAPVVTQEEGDGRC